MRDLSLVNQRVSETLKGENNEVVYKAWLFFTEDAQFEDGNIVIRVPNHYIKSTLEERYHSDIEELYRNEFDFLKLIIKTEVEELANRKAMALEQSFENSIESEENASDSLLENMKKIMLASNSFSVSL